MADWVMPQVVVVVVVLFTVILSTDTFVMKQYCMIIMANNYEKTERLLLLRVELCV